MQAFPSVVRPQRGAYPSGHVRSAGNLRRQVQVRPPDKIASATGIVRRRWPRCQAAARCIEVGGHVDVGQRRNTAIITPQSDHDQHAWKMRL